MTFSIVVPCYNEEKNIPLILKRFAKVIRTENIEVILIDNGSRDGTDKVLSELIPKFSFAKCVTVPENKGYGYGILQGLAATSGDYIGWTHADMQTDPKDVMKAFHIIEKKDSMNLFVKGRRRNRSILDVFCRMG